MRRGRDPGAHGGRDILGGGEVNVEAGGVGGVHGVCLCLGGIGEELDVIQQGIDVHAEASHVLGGHVNILGGDERVCEFDGG